MQDGFWQRCLVTSGAVTLAISVLNSYSWSEAIISFVVFAAVYYGTGRLTRFFRLTERFPILNVNLLQWLKDRLNK